ncbi:DUF1810 domain-containing protein [Novosphingobium sp. JCM 18896]|uniref:DUF1810 domain-containing protein n=1 Tax=Novosphingobium sp. JCM 18896 TaxID=2989731 RepID=UPI0022223116|nr:DUF1810 domain-containing protein [Novosphingobium sp. JCM 18896]MCW1430364.1 DUF1810 domain-containing protein [Novosphingobium sp. JCM 18896]
MPFLNLKSLRGKRGGTRRPESLERFVTAQQAIYPQALAELRAGDKQSHWMWFVFPQIAGLGRSEMAQRFALADRAEAEAYLAHPLLGSRLADCTDTMLGWAGRKNAEAILGPVDAVKFRSAMTLFEAAGGGARYARALDAFFGGERDGLTLAALD